MAWRTARLALVLALLALVVRPPPVSAGVDDAPPATVGPWMVAVGPELAVVVDEQGTVALTGAAEARLDACRATVGCAAFWDDGVGTFVIVHRSPTRAASRAGDAPSPDSAVTGGAPLVTDGAGAR